MRNGELGIAISVALHGAVIAWVAITDPLPENRELPRSEPVAIEVIAAPPPPPPPGVDVQFLDESTTRAIEASTAPPTAKPAKRRATGRATGGGTAAISTGTTGSEVPQGTGEPTGTKSKYFDMRRGSRADLTLPTGSFDALDNAPAGTKPQMGPPPTGLLEDAAGGRKKSDQDVFVAKVDRDGKVKITDARNLSAELSLNPAKLLSGRFDVTDYLMRRSKNDPYASRKLKFLDETRDERVALGMKFKQQQLQQTAMIMRKNLERAWASSTDYAVRKQALFELWDEIIEADGSDEILAEASRTARKAVIGFIRARLPQGSEHAFTEREVIAMNERRQSSARFTPYE